MPKEASVNLLEIINERDNDNLNNNSDISNTSEILEENTKFKMCYEILDKNYENLDNKEKKIFNLEKNNQNIINNKNIDESLENMKN